MKLILIARASTFDQTQSLVVQLETIRNWAVIMGHEITHEMTALESGKLERRQTVEDALVLIRQGEAEGIVCTKLDRLGRSLQELCRISGELDKLKASLFCTEQMVDTSNAQGRFFFQVMGAVAEWERSIIIERCAEGRKQAKKEGKVVGSTHYGFGIGEDGKLAINIEEHKVIEWMRYYLHSGKTMLETAKAMNRKGLRTRRGKLWREDMVAHVARKHGLARRLNVGDTKKHA